MNRFFILKEEFLGARSLKNRSLVILNEDFEDEGNDKSTF